MKRKPLLIVLTILLIILSLSLYAFVINLPKEIKNENIGSMYTFGQISFDLTSDQYAQDEEVIEAYKERGLGEEDIMILHNEQIGDTITILQITNDETKEFRDMSFRIFSNPILRVFISEEVNKKLEENRDVRGRHTLYEGKKKKGMISKYAKGDGNSTTYSADIKIDNQYYTIIPYQPSGHNQLALENIMEFMRTVNINQ